jgi:hypothetical protein
MTRTLPAVIILGLLTACGTPQEQCIAQNTRDLRTLDRLIGRTEADLARGFGYEDIVVTDTIWVRCDSHDVVMPDGSVRPGSSRMCLDDISRTERRPVAIDLAAEQSKLRGMKAKRAELAGRASAVIAACKRQYPE